MEHAALMEKSDKSLLEAHFRGDKEAFEQLVRRYGSSMLGYLTKVSGSREEAEDLFQETFRRVHEKAQTLRGNRFKPWLFSIATRVALDGLRRRKRQRVVSLSGASDCADRVSDAIVADNGCGPAVEAVRSEQIEQVRRAVESLPPVQRATLVLAYYQQLSYREVAEVLGCSIGTVKTQMYRALRTLAGRLPEMHTGDE
jgi:RNA polymerase sigma-70 factor (ECF subfamily)